MQRKRISTLLRNCFMSFTNIIREMLTFIRELAAEKECDTAELGVWYENYDAVDFFC